MKQCKRMAALLLALMLVVGILPMSAGAQNMLPDKLPAPDAGDLTPFAETVKDTTPILAAVPAAENEVQALTSGTCGDNLTWKYENNDLTISGTGDMYDYSDANPAPWSDHAGGIMNIFIEEGVTSIGDQAFIDFTRLIRVYIRKDVARVGSRAFDGSDKCTLYFMGDIPDIAPDAFAGFECNPYYFRDWDASALQNYGGTATWKKGTIYLRSSSKQLYQLNEPIKAEDLVFGAYSFSTYTFSYTPGKVEIGDYDNSTLGQKSVQINVDGTELTHTYYVTDNNSHLDLINVEYEPINYYTGFAVYCDPVVKAGDTVLSQGAHYTISYQNNVNVGTDASFTIKGMGIYADFEKTYPFAILEMDIANATITVSDTAFYGIPVAPEYSVMMFYKGANWTLSEGKDYEVYYENNVNVGTATIHIVGIGGYRGEATADFEIIQGDTEIRLSGAYNGSANDDTLNDDYAYVEGLMSPGVFTGKIDSPYYHVAYYSLYRIEGEDAVLVKEFESDYGTFSDTAFTYDFTNVYNSKSADGGETYMLTYSWMDSSYHIYSGACVMYISAKVPAASAMVMERITVDNDFRQEYLAVSGEDGVLSNVNWISSDDSVVTVSDGAVTLKKPGTVTITAASGKCTASQDITVPVLDLADGVIFSYDSAANTAVVIYEGELLAVRTDYLMTTSEKDGVTDVIITGCGLFKGQLMRQFDTATGEAMGHTHTFDNACDATCGACDFTRDTDHQYGTEWTKDMDGHWHACSICGDKADYAEHTLSPDDDTLCTVCGTLYIPGDLNRDFTVNEDDAIYLLQHVLLPDFFPVEQAVDYTGDGQINEDDAIYLLQHVLLPDFFPLG